MQQTNKREITPDEIRASFWSRIEKILAEKGCKTRQEQADMLGVSVNTRDNWKNKLSSPDYYTIVRIAHELNVSIDYLIDPTVNIRTTEANIRAARKTTGLSEKAVQLLTEFQTKKQMEPAAIISAIIETCLKAGRNIDNVDEFQGTWIKIQNLNGPIAYGNLILLFEYFLKADTQRMPIEKVKEDPALYQDYVKSFDTFDLSCLQLLRLITKITTPDNSIHDDFLRTYEDIKEGR